MCGASDDGWRDSYDEWKLRSPYDDEPEEECWHENYELDWQGLATMRPLRKCWEASAEEVAAERRRSEDYDTWWSARGAPRAPGAMVRVAPVLAPV